MQTTPVVKMTVTPRVKLKDGRTAEVLERDPFLHVIQVRVTKTGEELWLLAEAIEVGDE